MRNLSSTFWYGTAVALALAATPAGAQTVPAPSPVPTVDPTADPATDAAAPTPADPAAAAAPGDDATIVVTGIRRSLQSAQNIKRNSQQIVDAIVAEDIGKLPDVTASAAVARIPGVQVNRAAAEAAQVQVRGLPDLSTTYNSREIFTANDRFVAIQDFPAGSVAALEVFKSGTADLIEGGLGGQVNVRSRRPFDFKGFELSGAFNVVRFTQKDDTDWNGNLLISNRWDVGDGGEFGVLVNAAMTNIDFLDSTREQSLVMRSGPGGVTVPDASALFYGSGDRYRPSANFAVEYRPNSDLRFYIDGLYQGYRGRDSNLFMFVPLYSGDLVYSNVKADDDGQIQSYSARGGPAPDGFQEFFKDKTNTFQIGGGTSYDLGTLKLSGDIAYTDSSYRRRQENVDFALKTSPDRNITVDAASGPGGPGFEFVNFDASDGNQWLFRGLFERHELNKGDDLQMRADADWETGVAMVPRLQVGIRHNNRAASRREGGHYQYQLYRGLLLTETPLGGQPLECGFDYDKVQGTRCLFGTTYNDVFDNLDEIRQFVNFGDGQSNGPAFDPLTFFEAKEKASAGYAQIRYQFNAGIPIDGNIGVRVVRTRTDLSGNQRDVAAGTTQPVERSNAYTDVLPNISARFEFRPNLQGRLAYTETRTRPNFRDLSPSVTLFPATSACTVVAGNANTGPGSTACFQNAAGGNPDLRPITSRNYDATLEYYFGHQGSVSLAAFRRDIRDFVFGGTQDIPGGSNVNFVRLSAPFNGGKGKIRGIEAALTTFFDFAGLPSWAKGFGVQANYTYIDASTELGAQYRNQLPGQQDFPGVSKHAYNLIGIYEKGPVSARLAYNKRSKFVTDYRDIQGFQAPVIQRSLGQLDFSASYTPFENVTIAFDALNLLAGSEPIRTYREYNKAGDSYPWNVKYLERVFSLGVRFRH